jgi:D-alanyl-D-alanine carboxypeptidase
VTPTRAARLRRLLGARRFTAPEPPPRLRVSADALPAAESARVAAAVTEALEHAHAPGAQVAIRRRGRLLWAACAGRLDRAGAPVEPSDRFVLASTAKLATACVLMQLAERRALELDEPVARTLPALPHAGRLTPRLLLAHRSGLPEYARDPVLAARLGGGEPDHPWTRAEVIAAIARLGPERAPDRRFAYRDSNYVVAAELAERVSGEDFAALVDALIAEPLGLPGFSCARTVPGTRLATPHTAVLGRPVDLLATTGGRVPGDAFGPIWGDGAVASSALDLARFTEALFGGELVGRAGLRAMVTRVSRFGRRRGYGLGVQLERVPGAVLAGHDGIYFGWTAATSIDDTSATTVAVVTSLAAPGVPAARVASAARRGVNLGT